MSKFQILKKIQEQHLKKKKKKNSRPTKIKNHISMSLFLSPTFFLKEQWDFRLAKVIIESGNGDFVVAKCVWPNKSGKGR